MTRVLVSKRTRTEFRAFLMGWTLGEIEFVGADIDPATVAGTGIGPRIGAFGPDSHQAKDGRARLGYRLGDK